MTESARKPKCCLCNSRLPGRALRGKKPVNLLCESCGEKLRKRCGLCGDDFSPSSLKGTRFVYCLSCSRSYSKNYNKHSQTIGKSLSERECLWCLKPFMPPSIRSKCCSVSCNRSHNMHVSNTGEKYRSSKLIVCQCGKLISRQSRHCPSCRGANCSVEGCDKPVKSAGFCENHYRRNRRGLDLHASRSELRRAPICSFDACDRPMSQDDLCRFHLSRRDRGIPLDAPKNYQRPRPAKLCTHPGCDRKHHGQGLCSFHYSRLINGQDLDAPPGNQKRYTNEICLMEDCDKPHAQKGYGLCKSHFRARTSTKYKNGIHWLPLGDRDNWICHLCGEIVEKVAGTWDTPNGGNVDHLIPRSKGGQDEWDNVRLAHFWCNWERKDSDLELLNVES